MKENAKRLETQGTSVVVPIGEIISQVPSIGMLKEALKLQFLLVLE
jgi:hypothetical protein